MRAQTTSIGSAKLRTAGLPNSDISSPSKLADSLHLRASKQNLTLPCPSFFHAEHAAHYGNVARLRPSDNEQNIDAEVESTGLPSRAEFRLNNEH